MIKILWVVLWCNYTCSSGALHVIKYSGRGSVILSQAPYLEVLCEQTQGWA